MLCCSRVVFCFYQESYSLPLLAEPLPRWVWSWARDIFLWFLKKEGDWIPVAEKQGKKQNNDNKTPRTFYLLRNINSRWEFYTVFIVTLPLDHSYLIIIYWKAESILGRKFYFQDHRKVSDLSLLYFQLWGLWLCYVYLSIHNNCRSINKRFFPLTLKLCCFIRARG